MTREGYLERMAELPQFKHFRIKPLWEPGTGDVEGFIHDEVVRQWHNTKVMSDGGIRIQGMLDAWYYARSWSRKEPTIDHVLTIGKMIEPYVNEFGFRRDSLEVGGREALHPISLMPAMKALFRRVHYLDPIEGATKDWRDYTWGEFESQVGSIQTADDFYLAFEWIHPFGDGNGRTGKILHNWLLGSMDDPVLVENYFDGSIP